MPGTQMLLGLQAGLGLGFETLGWARVGNLPRCQARAGPGFRNAARQPTEGEYLVGHSCHRCLERTGAYLIRRREIVAGTPKIKLCNNAFSITHQTPNQRNRGTEQSCQSGIGWATTTTIHYNAVQPHNYTLHAVHVLHDAAGCASCQRG